MAKRAGKLLRLEPKVSRTRISPCAGEIVDGTPIHEGQTTDAGETGVHGTAHQIVDLGPRGRRAADLLDAEGTRQAHQVAGAEHVLVDCPRYIGHAEIQVTARHVESAAARCIAGDVKENSSADGVDVQGPAAQGEVVV